MAANLLLFLGRKNGTASADLAAVASKKKEEATKRLIILLEVDINLCARVESLSRILHAVCFKGVSKILMKSKNRINNLN